MRDRYESGFMLPPVTPEQRWVEAQRIIGEVFDGTALGVTKENRTYSVTCKDEAGGEHVLNMWRRVDRQGMHKGTRITHAHPRGTEDEYDLLESGDPIRNVADTPWQIERNKQRLSVVLSRISLVGLSQDDHEAFERIAAYSSRGSESRTNPLYMRGGYNALYQRQLTSAPHSATE